MTRAICYGIAAVANLVLPLRFGHIARRDTQSCAPLTIASQRTFAHSAPRYSSDSSDPSKKDQDKPPIQSAMDELQHQLFADILPEKPKELRTSKVSLVGVGAVGMACAYTILTKGLAGELVLCDVKREQLEGEVMDLQHAGSFLSGKVIMAGEDYAETKGSDICIITAGVRQREGESRLALTGRNVEVLRSIVPPLVKLSPDTIFIVVSNPVDILTYITWKLSGLPQHRVIGSGTFLDSSRFRSLLASRLGVSAQSVHGWIIGEHGDSSVPVWSGVNVAGVPIAQLLEKKAEDLDEFAGMHKQVVEAAYHVIKCKGYTNWAIGAAVGCLVDVILHDKKRVVPISTHVKGVYSVDHDVFLSVPCVLSRRGVEKVLVQPLTSDEQDLFRKSAESLWDVQSKLTI